ncbi:MAG: AAA family ATPase, partial [Pseudomonadota bacterium]
RPARRRGGWSSPGSPRGARRTGAAPETTAPAEAYDEAVSQQVLVRMARDTGRALRAGISVIVDATFLGPDWRAAVTRAAAQSHARFDGLWLAAPDILRVARAEGRAEERATRSDASGATDPSDAGPAIAAAQSATAPEEAGWRIVSAEGAPDAVLAAAIAALTVDDRETV